MARWYTKTRVIALVYIFPAIFMCLVPLSAEILDFLTLSALLGSFGAIIVARLGFFSFVKMSLPPLIVGSGVLRMMTCGLILRKIVLMGPNFDGQIIRIVCEQFYSSSFHANLTYIGLALVMFALIVKAYGRRIADIAEVFVEVQIPHETGQLVRTKAVGGNSENVVREISDKRETYRALGTSARYLVIESRIIIGFQLMFLALGLVAGATLRNEFGLKALRIYSLLALGTVVVLELPALANLYALLGLIHRLDSKNKIKLDIQGFMVEHKWFVLFASVAIIGLSFSRSFPHLLLLSIGAVTMLACILVNIAHESRLREIAQREREILLEKEIVQIPNSPVSIHLGNELWTNWYQRKLGSIESALEEVRIDTARHTEVLIPSFNILPNQKINKDKFAILINEKKVSEGVIRPLKSLHKRKKNRSSKKGGIGNLVGGRQTITYSKEAQLKLCSQLSAATIKYSKNITGDPAVQLLLAEIV